LTPKPPKRYRRIDKRPVLSQFDGQAGMEDRGLQEAIRAAGGVTELARRIGVSQPSVSNWSRVPSQRVVSVEAATGVPRSILRPDLYAVAERALDEVDAARADEYLLLAQLLSQAPSAALLRRIARLRGDGTQLGTAHAALAQAATGADVEKVGREFFDLFIGVVRGELLPYASYYLTGFLNERPLARLRADLNALGIERSEGRSEPEDHAAILCEVMSGMIRGQLPGTEADQRRVFDKHVAPWMSRFFGDLERVAGAEFYRHVGVVGRLFIEIEKEAFALPG
jgi:TorA maturation chaperone TorD